MICACVENLIEPYQESRLVAFQARWVERHLTACPRCAAKAAAWDRVLRELRALPIPTVPMALKTALKASLRRMPRTEPAEDEVLAPAWIPPAPPLALALGCAAFLFSLSASIFGPGLPNQGCSNDDTSVCLLSSVKVIARRHP